MVDDKLVLTSKQLVEHLKGFYGVTTLEELVSMQSLHIGRLQAKLDIHKPKPKLNNEIRSVTREG